MWGFSRSRIWGLALASLYGLCFTLPAAGKIQVGEHIPVKIDTPWNYAGSAGAEVAWRYELSHPGATYIAVHFHDFQLAPGDRLTVSDPNGEQAYVLRSKGKQEAGTFWARHIKGDTAVLELTVVNPNGGQGFRIDEYVAGFTYIGPVVEAICGVDDKENAVCYQSSHAAEYDRGRAVARLLINGSGLCTGWLVSNDDHLLTNEHCITSASDALNTDYEFMSEAPNCSDTNCQLCFPGDVFSGGTFIQDDSGLDYCLVQVTSGTPAATYGYIEIDDRVAVPDEEMYIPQHPGGRAKEFGIYSTAAADTGGICRVYSITEPPCAGSGYYDVGYYCDTEGGSSGSPVLARSSHKAIALHHCADCPNRGVPINLVYAEISDIIISSGLKVTPGGGLVSEGDAGGPFTPDSEVYTLENLNATPLDYNVTKTAAWVSLSDTGGTLAGGATTTVTVSINSNANSLPEGGYSDTVSFVNLTDGDGDTTRPVDLTVGVPTLQYSWNMDTNPGWTTEGLWAFGQPTGGGGQYGNPDPTSGATGTNVYGYNLAGDYENSLPERHLTSGAIDCSSLSALSLRFQRYLGVEQPAYDHAYVRVSNDGSSWTTVWTNGAVVEDSSWSQVDYDISAVADGQATVYLRWTMGTTDTSWQYCGWNIDDVEIWGLGGGDCTGPEDCDDGLWCNGAEDCVEGTCVPGTPPDCSDTVGCTDDSCNEGTDSCDNTPNDANCDNGQWCDGAEWCDAVSDCQLGTAPDCTDTVGCTDDSCNEGTDSCDNVPNDGLCDNGLYCDGAETCHVTLDCQAGTAVDCDDGVGCTDDSCNEGTDSCDNIANDAYCPDDGLFCNGTEYCDAVADCSSTGDPCTGGDVCNEVTDTCDPSACDGDLVCESGEDCNNCPSDCISGVGSAVCGNGLCEAGDGEDCRSCSEDCNGITTGAPSGRFCCGATEGCGDIRCTTDGWTCTTEVQGVSYCCGDGTCEGDESGLNCEIDCGVEPYCGDGSCNGDEDQCSCPDDCGTPPASEVPNSTCVDGIDNDCDGATDCADADCYGIDPNCPECLLKGEPCEDDAECCSNRCFKGFCK